MNIHEGEYQQKEETQAARGATWHGCRDRMGERGRSAPVLGRRNVESAAQWRFYHALIKSVACCGRGRPHSFGSSAKMRQAARKSAFLTPPAQRSTEWR